MHENVRSWVDRSGPAPTCGFYLDGVTVLQAVDAKSSDDLEALRDMVSASLHWWLCEAFDLHLAARVRYYQYADGVAALSIEAAQTAESSGLPALTGVINSMLTVADLPAVATVDMSDSNFERELSAAYAVYATDY